MTSTATAKTATAVVTAAEQVDVAVDAVAAGARKVVAFFTPKSVRVRAAKERALLAEVERLFV